MIIGKFLANSDEHMFWGEVSFIDYPVHILSPRRVKSARPDFHVVGKGMFGYLDFGAAWRRKDAKTGEEYLEIVLDNPAWPARISARLVSNHDEDHSFNLSWQRSQAIPRRTRQ